jgi:hypothetical protein
MLGLRESMGIAEKDYGKSRLSQILEISKLILGPGRNCIEILE